ncbi:PEP-CTERM sorting domain-containing protein [Calothrix sp. PCC 6303]|uniref:PEP-CTERM sorting domain-containing protein n=1 Tax=Calothrix sp. PCC 6303 TaxID=1170562 RepID=UPI0002A02D25|nr:PEP-CTERM sorting domain-containing protein [Calothrix sp. PCC 6303]AFY99968.1 PEP motif putative anchor domain protein [Calothrix sp. PCC 6303]
MFKKVFSTLLPFSIAATALSTTPVFAGTLDFATNVLEYKEGQGIQTSWRRITDNALGSYDKGYKGEEADVEKFFHTKNQNFLSLGLGGEAIFEFGKKFTKEVTVWETTWGSANEKQSYHDERIQIFVGNDLKNWLSIGTIKNIADGAYKEKEGATLQIGNNDTYKYVRVVDKSQVADGRDGFDVNAIAVRGVTQAVPEPGAILGLLAVGGMVVAKSKKQKTA